jgi:hypothetical protein
MLLEILRILQEDNGKGKSGFFISEDLLAMGYQPNVLMLVLAYMFLTSAVTLYIVFGMSFLNKARATESGSAYAGQRSYYRGLGLFIISVALAQVLTIIDWLSMDIYDRGFFMTTDNYNPPFASMIGGDEYIVGFTMIFISLSFLLYPLEKYLLQKRVILSIIVIIAIPLPTIIRLIEINHQTFGLDLSERSIQQKIFVGIWLAVIMVVIAAVLFVMKLYIDLGVKSPPGSQLRKKSKLVVIGLIIWIICLFTTSRIMSYISDVTSVFGPNAPPPTPGSLQYLIQSLNLYALFPFLIPILLYLALYLLLTGFKRDF